MALYPCSIDSYRYRGPQQTAYPAIVKGRDSERKTLRLCPTHFNDVLQYCRDNLEEVVYDSPEPTQERIPACFSCGGVLTDPFMVFVTVYAQHEDESQFYGRMCAKCEAKVAARLHIRS